MTVLRAALAGLVMWAGLGMPAALSAAADPRPFGVWFYADWCMNCKLIAPKLAVVEPEFASKIRFYKFDFTDESHDSENFKLASSLGIRDMLMGTHKTGWVALFDASGKQVGELKQQMTPDEMRAVLKQVAAR